MKKIQKKDIYIFLIIITVTFLIFIPFLNVHFATDTYIVIDKGYGKCAFLSFKDGRVIMAIIGKIAEAFSIHYSLYIVGLTVLALITLCITVMVLKKIIEKYKKSDNKISEFLLTIICYYTIFNFMFIENMYFLECFVMSLSILFYLLAANTVIERKNNYVLKSLIFMILGTISYQGTISMYLISLVMFSILKNEKNIKEIIKDLLIGFFIATVGMVFQILMIKLIERVFNVEQTRMIKGIETINKNIKTIKLTFLENLKETGKVFPENLYIFFVSIIFVISIIKIIKEKLSKSIILKIIFIISCCIIFGFVISVISTSGLFSARLRYSIGATIGIVFIYLWCKTDLQNLDNKLNYILICIFIFYGTITTVNYIFIMNNSLQVNKKDNEFAIEIAEYIQKYEQDNNIKVDKIAIVKGIGSSKAYYKCLNYLDSIVNWSAIRTTWSAEGAIEFYTNKELELVEVSIEQKEYYYENVEEQKDYLCIDNILFVSYYVS